MTNFISLNYSNHCLWTMLSFPYLDQGIITPNQAVIHKKYDWRAIFYPDLIKVTPYGEYPWFESG